ncbi:MAG: HlyD family efflux transporter periplasmic adaptor subunit [Ginsengibacter sp.]
MNKDNDLAITDTTASFPTNNQDAQEDFGTTFRQRSEAAQEIISHHPGFLEKWALLLISGILCLLFACTWFIRYPDIIETSGLLTADNAPKEIVPLVSGRLIKMFVKNGDKMKKDGTIGWVESTADTKEILGLSECIDSSLSLLQSDDTKNFPALFKKDYKNLGEIQTLYQSFTTAWQQYDDYVLNGFYNRKKEMLIKDFAALRAMNTTIKQQKTYTKQDKDSSEKSLRMNKILLNEKVISPEEYRVATSAYISKEMSIPQYNAGILSNENQQRDKLKELEQLDHDASQQKIIFEQALQTLKSSVDDWKQKYILKSPLAGTVFFSIPMQQNKFIQQGKLLGYINPDNSKFFMEINLPQNNFGKVDTGMKVQLRFDAYPYEEVGFVKGNLNFISKIATDSGFYATVNLDNGLTTNLGKHIQYKNGLKAEALVITKNRRLLQRIYYSIVKTTSVGK